MAAPGSSKAAAVRPSRASKNATRTAMLSEQAVLLENFVGVVLVDQHGRQRDDGRYLFSIQQLDRLAQTFGARRGVEECRRQLTFVHPGHALVGKRVDADEELDVLDATGVLGGKIGAIRHRIVVAIDQV